MPMIPPLLEANIKAAVFGELQSQFLSEVPPEHQQPITEYHNKLATAVSKMAAVIIDHIKQNMQATSQVTTTVNTIVATVGSPSAQTGTGTGAGVGTGLLAPGSFL